MQITEQEKREKIREYQEDYLKRYPSYILDYKEIHNKHIERYNNEHREAFKIRARERYKKRREQDPLFSEKERERYCKYKVQSSIKSKERRENLKRNNPKEYLFRIIKNISSKKRNEICTLTIDDIIIPEKCPYFDIAFNIKESKKYDDFYPSIDRIDSTKGYIKGNIQVISYLANRCKNGVTIEQLVIFAKNIINIHENNIKQNYEFMDIYYTDKEYYKDRSNRLFEKARSRARKNNLEFNIQRSDIIIPKYCPYFGTELRFKDLWNSPTIDRVDSSKGYVKGNVQIISYRANSCKNDASISNLIIFAKNVLKLHDNK